MPNFNYIPKLKSNHTPAFQIAGLQKAVVRSQKGKAGLFWIRIGRLNFSVIKMTKMLINKSVIVILIIVLFSSCLQSNPKVGSDLESTGIAKDHGGYPSSSEPTTAKPNVSQENIPPQDYSDCDSLSMKKTFYWRHKDSILKVILKKHEATLPEQNKLLLMELMKERDSRLRFRQPLAAVFKGVAKESFMISNSYWFRSEDGYSEMYPEDSLLQIVDTIPTENPEWERRYFEGALNDYPENLKQLNIIGTSKVYKGTVSVLGRQNSECEPYVFYTLTFVKEDAQLTPLITSPFQIELEYGNWPAVDSLIRSDPYLECIDCLTSYDQERTFARLTGTSNLYFAFQGPGEEAEDAWTPNRSLIYVNENNEVIDLWSDSIDLFGCSCL